MTISAGRSPLSRVVTRLAVVGMALAVLALGALAVWSTTVTQEETDGLTRVGVQTAGQLRAMQAQSVIRTQTNALEDDFTEEGLAKLRAGQAALPKALAQMESGGAAEAVEVARKAQQLQSGLDAKIEIWLADLRAGRSLDESETRTDEILTQLEILLNDSSSDPALLLGDKLDKVTSSTRAVRRTAYVLIPLGLIGVLACGWLLSSYRRRADAIMREALEAMAREARTDQLTALPNRRGLLDEIERRVAGGGPFFLAIADLNGFKHYNDTFGHPAGDELLRRLGSKLAVAWEGHGYASRLGGDEFCVVADDMTPDQLQSVLHEALSENGEGFHISAVSGVAHIPDETGDASAALSLADNRLYAAKAVFHATHGTSRPAKPIDQIAIDVVSSGLIGLLDDDQPDLDHHLLTGMAGLAVTCAEAVGVPADQLAIIESAAQLHDIGKVAIPAAILTKPTPLTDDERNFIRRHAAIGERLLAVNDTLEPMAGVVRAIHERWDGAGYPDQLAGEQIPVGARIIAAVEAFYAMIGDRPYAPKRSVADALAELNRCSGTQFDPAVVAALTEAVGRLGPHVQLSDLVKPAG